MKRSFSIYICLIMFMPTCLFSQKNEIGWQDGYAFYGNSYLSPMYDGKYTLQSGDAIEYGLYYTRFFKEGKSDVTVYFDFTDRTKNVIDTASTYNILQSFVRFKLMYHWRKQLSERWEVATGAGLYFAEGSEYWKFADSTKDTTVRETGVQFGGIVLDASITYNIRKRSYAGAILSVGFDAYTSIKNSHLRTITLGLNYGWRF